MSALGYFCAFLIHHNCLSICIDQAILYCHLSIISFCTLKLSCQSPGIANWLYCLPLSFIQYCAENETLTFQSAIAQNMTMTMISIRMRHVGFAWWVHDHSRDEWILTCHLNLMRVSFRTLCKKVPRSSIHSAYHRSLPSRTSLQPGKDQIALYTLVAILTFPNIHIYIIDLSRCRLIIDAIRQDRS